MCPVKIYHSLLQGEIGFLLRCLLTDGKALPECAIKTRKGIKVADVAWASAALLEEIKYMAETDKAPEICVEVVSANNSPQEMLERQQLYFEAGAQEVWLCNEKGELAFFNAQRPLPHSVLVPAFPLKIDV